MKSLIRQVEQEMKLSKSSFEDCIKRLSLTMRLPKWSEKGSFHDCLITQIKIEQGYKLTIYFGSGGFTNISELTFENFEIVEQSEPLENCYCQYWLLLEHKGVFEFCIGYQSNSKEAKELFRATKNVTYVKFIVKSSYISCKRNSIE